MRKFKLFFACLLMAVLSIGQVWGDSYTINFANGANSATAISSSTQASTVIANDGSRSYVTSQPFTIGSGNVYYGDTQSCIRLGKSGNASELEIALSTTGQVTATTIVVNCNNTGGTKNTGATLSCNGKTAQTTTETASDYTFTINDDITSITLAGSASIKVYSITVNYTTSGSSTPSVTVNPAELDFGTIGVGDAAPAAQEFTITGSNLTSALTVTSSNTSLYTVAVKSGSSLTPSTGSVSATIVVTPQAAINGSAETKSATITVAGGGLAQADQKTVAVSTEVKAKHNIIFNNGNVKDIANVAVMEGATYSTLPTIEDALISSCTYKKFEGWTLSSSIAYASVKPTLVNSVEMEDEDVDLYAVYSITTGGAANPTAYSAGDEGDFVLAAYYNSKWYALPTNPTVSGGKIAGVEITVNTSAGDVDYVSTSNAVGYTWTIADATNGQTISDGTKNLYHSNGGASGTNLDYGTGTYTWSITADANGPIMAGQDGETVGGRGMLFAHSSTTDKKFGGFALSNKDGSDYERVQILPIASAGTTTYSLDAGCAAPTCANLDAPTLNGEVVKTQTSATIKWNAVADASSYLVNVTKHEGGASAFSGNVGNVLSKELTGLDANTQYDFSIMAVGDGTEKCADGNELLESNFTTPDYPTVTVTYSENGNTDNQVSKKIHTPFNLPTSAAACGKTFVGWTTNSEFVNGDESKASYYAKGAEFTITSNANITIYAVYADVTYGPATWDEITAVPTEGTYAICTDGYFLKAGISSDRFENGTATPVIEAGQLTTAPATDCQWEISINAGGKFLIKNGTNYAAGTGAKNKGQLITDATDTKAQWTIAYSEGFTVTNVANAAASVNATLRNNSTYGWACYAADFGTAPRFFKKNASISGASNYSITCVGAPTATPASNSLEVSAAGVNDATLGVTYDNVNLAGVSVDICNDDQGAAFTGDWLTASVAGDDKHIVYTAQANNSYNETRTAYIQLTAPETSGVASPAVVYIEVTQAKKPAVFGNLADLVAANVNTGTQVTVTFEEVITNVQTISGPKRAGVMLTTPAGSQSKAIEIFYNQGTTAVPAEWQIGGKLAATSMSFTWTLFSGNQWELIPLGDSWMWDNGDLTYTAPKAVTSVVVSGGPTKTTYVDGEKFAPAGLTVTVNYNDATSEVNPTGVTFACDPERVAKGNTSVEVIATFNEVDSDPFEVTGLTVGDIQPMSIEDFIAAGGTRCYLEGTVETIKNTTYGNFDLTDGSGTIYVYGCLTPEGESAKFNTLDVSEGDKIKVIAEQYLNHATAGDEAVNVVFVSKISPVTITIADKTLEEGEEWTIVATTDPAAAVANISYSIKDGSDDCITLDNVNKKITANSVGTATIIASIPDGEGYLANSIEFEVEVVEAGSVVPVVILAQYDGQWYALMNEYYGTTTNSLKALAVDYNEADGVLFELTMEQQAAITWTRSIAAGKATFLNGTKYIAGGTGSTDLTLSDAASEWTIDGDHYMKGTRTFLYNDGGYFKNFAAASNVGKLHYSDYPVVLANPQFMTRVNVREAGITSGVWGTICPKKEVKYPAGASFFEISYVEYHSGVPYKVFYDEIAEGASLAAGHPYLFQADEESTAIKGIAVGDDATSAINDHGFKGVLENETISVVTADVENYRYYIVYNNEIRLCGEGQFLIRAERAYLDMSDPNVEKQYKAPIAGRRRVALTNNAPQVVTGMDELNASETPVKVMIDGKFYILRGEKMYDATGKLVK